MEINKKHLIGLSPNSKKIKLYKKSLNNLTAIQFETIIGLMLGDASIQTQNKGKTYRIKFEWGNKNKSYLDHVYSVFEEWVISEPHKKVRVSPKGNTIINWGFQTISHEVFIEIANLFNACALKENKKSVKKDLIKNFLTPRGLAYWFMDDGGKLDYNPNSKNKSIVLNTQSFTNNEVESMKNELIEKFNLKCELRWNKKKRIIVITNYDIFISLIDPYIITEMRYKLPS